MSVYSGFVSRSQESSYNKSLYNLICLLQLKISKSLNGGIIFFFSLSQKKHLMMNYLRNISPNSIKKYMAWMNSSISNPIFLMR